MPVTRETWSNKTWFLRHESWFIQYIQDFPSGLPSLLDEFETVYMHGYTPVVLFPRPVSQVFIMYIHAASNERGGRGGLP